MREQRGRPYPYELAGITALLVAVTFGAVLTWFFKKRCLERQFRQNERVVQEADDVPDPQVAMMMMSL